MQVRATRPIKAGEEILVAYGARWLGSQQQLLQMETLEEQQKEQQQINEQVYVHPGAAARWHCLKCKTHLPKNRRRNHVRLCQKIKT